MHAHKSSPAEACAQAGEGLLNRGQRVPLGGHSGVHHDQYALETIKWQPSILCHPDDDTTVLVRVPGADEPIWLGYHSEGEWYWVEGSTIGRPVTHWAHLPTGLLDSTPAGLGGPAAADTRPAVAGEEKV